MSVIGAQLISSVRMTAAEDPDFVYRLEHCVYVLENQPSCLLGHALWDLDLINEHIQELSVNDESFDYLSYWLELPLDEDELHWLTAAQECQDRRSTWGDAVQFADEARAKLASW